MVDGVWRRLRAAASAAQRAVTPSDAAWSAAAAAVLAVWAVVFLAMVVDLVAPHFSLEKVAGLVVLFAVLAVISAGALLVCGLLAALKRRYRIALLLALPPLFLVLMLAWGPKGAAIGAAVVLAAASLAAGSAAALLQRDAKRRIGAWVFLGLGAVLIGAALYGLFAPVPDPNPALAGYQLDDRTLDLPDPGQAGPYPVQNFTYGGGKDRFRPDYAAGARFRTRPVDGSKLDQQWNGPGGWIRSRYWGFDAKAFPVQGRVWMPDTATPGAQKGPFPLVLMVHGNHDMEDFSDPGYGYLGRQLASWGFIFVSVDENFLNSSMADFVNPFDPRRGKENAARGWLLLKHLEQWRAWTQDPRHPLFGQADLDRIALIGHSRGGEAVALANAFNPLDRDPDDATLPFDFHFKIKAIAAVAPIDGQYTPRRRPTPMRDTNSFVLHGSMDGDVTSFAGAAQYSRASFSGAAKAFKASLYIKGANHGQFNTAWGRNDLGAPFKFLLDETPIMDPQAQRRIARVYLTAFMLATLKGQDGYRPLFQDARNGAEWLPDDYLVNNYADSDTKWLANYEEDLDPATGSSPGVRITGRNLSVWREEFINLKWAPLGAHVAVLGWDDRASRKPASYGITLGEAAAQAGPDTELVFSASDAGISSLPKGFHPPKDKTSKDKDDRSRPLDWTIVVTDSAGAEARLPLSRDQLLYPQIKGQTRRIEAINTTASSEVVLRRYRFVLKDFAALNPRLDLSHLASVRFDFDRSPRGAIALDDIGLSPAR